MGKYSLDGTTRRIAGGCSLVAGAAAVFWLMRSRSGPVPAWGAALVDMNIVWFTALALFFGLAGVGRELSEVTTKAPFMYTVVSLGSAMGVALESYSHGAPDLGRAGLVTAAVVVGLCGGAYRVFQHRRPSAAQLVVAADGASPRP